MTLRLPKCVTLWTMLCALSACSGGSDEAGNAGTGTAPPLPPVQQPGISLVAGAAWQYAGALDGTLDVAKFNAPDGMAVDRTGNIYLVDAANYTIRKIDSNGQVSTLAGKAGAQGMVDGRGAQARFSQIANIASDAAGTIYVVDAGALRKITPDGTVSTMVLDVPLTGQAGMAIDAASNIYVADLLHFTISKITPAGIVTTLAGQSGVAGFADGAGSAARFMAPSGIALDAAGNLLVADQRTLRKVSPAGVVTTMAGDASNEGVVDGLGSAARFVSTGAVAIDSQGVLYVMDTSPDHAASVIRKVLPSGLVSTLAPNPAVNIYAGYLAIDGSGDLLVSDTRTNAVLAIKPTGQAETYAGGTRVEPPSRDGAALAAHFNGIRGVSADTAGNYYVTDNGNCSVRKITPTLQVSTLAGTPGACSRVAGRGAAAGFEDLGDLSSDPSGNLYAVDGGSVRKIAPDGTVSTLAGNGDSGSAKVDGAGAVAAFFQIKSISSDTKGKLFVSDGATYCRFSEGATGQAPVPSTLRTITPDGAVLTLPYASGYQGALADGLPAVATLGCISAVKNDSLDNLYFVDGQQNGRLFLRERTPEGTLKTLAPISIPLSMSGAEGVNLAPDGLGNLYIGYIDAVYMIDAKGAMTRIIGAQHEQGDALTLPSGISLNTINGLHYLGNKQLLVVTAQSVLKIALP